MITPKTFLGEWVPGSSTIPTVPGRTAHIRVEPSPHSPADIFVAAGCQQGYLHLLTAFQLAETLLDAVKEGMTNIVPPVYIIISNKKTAERTRISGSEIRAMGGHWSIFGSDGQLITGPHRPDLWSFRFEIDPRMDQLREKLESIRKEVKPPDEEKV